MTPAERVELSLRLGDDDLEVFRLAHCLSHEEARRELSRRRQQGRIPSRCLETLGR